jgi:hypothetical protein
MRALQLSAARQVMDSDSEMLNFQTTHSAEWPDTKIWIRVFAQLEVESFLMEAELTGFLVGMAAQQRVSSTMIGF